MAGSCTTTRVVLNDIPLRNNLRASNGACTFTRASSAWYEDDTGTVQVALTNIPRISPTKGLLIEEARTNYWTNSSNAGVWATNGHVSASINMESGPFATVMGGAEVDYIYNIDGVTAGAYQSPSLGTAQGPKTTSAYVAAGNSTSSSLQVYTAAPGSGGTYNSWNALSASFNRVVTTATIAGTPDGVIAALWVPNVLLPVSGAYIKVAHVQIESGSFATSPILTAGTAVTRAAENNTKVSTTGWSINSGRVMFDYIPIWSGVSGDNRILVDSRWPGGARGFIIFMDPQASAELNVVSGNAGGSTQIASAVLVWTIGVTYRIEYAWGRGNMYLWRTAAGVKTLVASNLTGTAQMPDTFNPTAGICTSAAGGDPRIANGSISNLRVSRI